MRDDSNTPSLWQGEKQEGSKCLNLQQSDRGRVLCSRTPSGPAAADGHAKCCRERYKRTERKKKRKKNYINEPRQLESFIMCHLFLFEFFFPTNDIQFNCRLADNNLSLS